MISSMESTRGRSGWEIVSNHAEERSFKQHIFGTSNMSPDCIRNLSERGAEGFSRRRFHRDGKSNGEERDNKLHKSRLYIMSCTRAGRVSSCGGRESVRRVLVSMRRRVSCTEANGGVDATMGGWSTVGSTRTSVIRVWDGCLSSSSFDDKSGGIGRFTISSSRGL